MQGKVLLKGTVKGGLYQLSSIKGSHSSKPKTIDNQTQAISLFATFSNSSQPETLESRSVKSNTESSSHPSIDVLHRKFGHPNAPAMKSILSICKNTFDINESQVSSFCNACQYGKLYRLNFKSTENKTTEPLEILHTDLWGPAPITSKNGHKYS